LLYQIEVEFERQTSAGFVESDDLDQRQSNVDNDWLDVVADWTVLRLQRLA